MSLPATKADAKKLGLSFYFTGKPCKKGHTSKRRVVNSGCHECKKLADAARREKPEYKKSMRELQAGRRSDPKIRAAELEAQSTRRRTEEYREKVKPFNRGYKKANRGKYNAYDAKRSAAKLQRTPAWLSEQHKNDILGVYEQARQLTKTSGEEHHVDHIIPLQGVLVSGLHVPWNLQILTALENMKKNNSFKAVA